MVHGMQLTRNVPNNIIDTVMHGKIGNIWSHTLIIFISNFFLLIIILQIVIIIIIICSQCFELEKYTILGQKNKMIIAD